MADKAQKWVAPRRGAGKESNLTYRLRLYVSHALTPRRCEIARERCTLKYMRPRNFAVGVRLGIATFLFISLATLGLTSDSLPLPSNRSNAPRAEEHEVLAQKFVKDKLKLWQSRLNLEKWDIRVELVRAASLKPKTLGNIHWDSDTMQATVNVLSSYDYKLPLQEMLDDMEFTVVHELVHLQLSSLPRSEASRSAEEHAVNEVTQALLKLARH